MSWRMNLKAALAVQMFDVVRSAGDEIIDAMTSWPFGQEMLAEVRADKAGTAGDDRSHVCSLQEVCLIGLWMIHVVREHLRGETGASTADSISG